MKPYLLAAFLAVSSAWAADDAALLAKGTLVFEDDFNRKESATDKEEIGNGWTTNSAKRAKGSKQAALEDGALHVTKAGVADHSVGVRHEVAFQDGAVQLRFKLGEGEALGVGFLDRDLKTVHAGHICLAHITPKSLNLSDQKTGAMDLKIHDARLAGPLPPETAALLKTKTKAFPINLKLGEWHQLLVVIEGDTMRASIDGQPIGEFKSEGIAHPTKHALNLGVDKSAWVDDLKVWKLK